MDSRIDTYKHIQQVQQLLFEVVKRLLDRAAAHDQSKLVPPEVELFDEFTPKLAESTYGSAEYEGFRAAMKPALDHHYSHNQHHPEFAFCNEEWRPVVGYEGEYEVSNLGSVRSCDRLVNSHGGSVYTKPGQVMKLFLTPKGYLRTQLSSHGTNRNFMVHRLVALSFLPNPDNKPEVNHKNGIKTDNFVDNLEWSTQSEKQKHAYKLGLKEPAVKYVVTCNELDITTLGCEKMEKILREKGYDRVYSSGIWACINGVHETSGGLTFVGEPIQEYRRNLLCKMSLLDLIEMIVDWCAAVTQHNNGDIRKSIDINQERFGYDDEIKSILLNTVNELGL